MGCTSCGKKYNASSGIAKVRSTPPGSRMKIAVKKDMKVKVQPQPEAGNKVPDTRGPIDPSTGVPISVIKTGTQGPVLGKTPVQEPITFKETPKGGNG